jgi:hypothetical protein
MTALVPITMFGWIAVVLVLFGLIPSRRAALLAYLGAWLFLPVAGYQAWGIGEYDKSTAAAIGVVLGILLFDFGRFSSWQGCWADAVALIWCACPLMSCISAGLTVYDGFVAVSRQCALFGVPYGIGRLYFSDLLGMRDLAIGIFLGGIVYVPLCLYEVRMSPQLHTMLYGFYPHQFMQARRYGGWRPTVFMQHGLAVAAWMTTATVLSVWLWRTRVLTSVWRVPMWLSVVLLLSTAVMCKSFGPLVLMLVGISVLVLTRMFHLRIFMLCLVLAAPTYMFVRVTGLWSGESLVDVSAAVADEGRADSLKVRMLNEDIVIARGWTRPFFGWAWASYLMDDGGARDALTDGLWIWAFGHYGFVGLAALTAFILGPAAIFCRSIPGRHWADEALAPAAGLAVILCLHMIDDLFNGMINPCFLLAAGGLVGFATTRKPSVSRCAVRKSECSRCPPYEFVPSSAGLAVRSRCRERSGHRG